MHYSQLQDVTVSSMPQAVATGVHAHVRRLSATPRFGWSFRYSRYIVASIDIVSKRPNRNRHSLGNVHIDIISIYRYIVPSLLCTVFCGQNTHVFLQTFVLSGKTGRILRTFPFFFLLPRRKTSKDFNTGDIPWTFLGFFVTSASPSWVDPNSGIPRP